MAKHILIIDDQESMLQILSQTLKDQGYEVTTANNGEEGLSKIKADPQAFNLILSDVNMPSLNGFELLKQVKESQPRIPVIFCTSMNEDVVVTLGKEFKVDGVIKKPFEVEDVLKTIAQVIANNQ
ncbi:hypothetical protein A2291_04985 [candidate division WOR-1 bacterium RIFOXYB2_FULL_42_35]|uniref:Response regulatory domain-containing protein n=1 Tax=candidate division WOR-1 bacterium RIFOXYC2_FULL_41_25 TaxID=1802586 RepID=A0A1F4TNP7_UNCSA|nr:MAG: hypothetical protein A2247_07185 [candidate division WOR-1 bacterium RIFOXYA2_FULL_41_14]OGC24684.1 MAG: hypothetical protein A2291_04985 [candidate division WOR-1 bacterium RIFOXYB2_FULL_42_35]OGC34199.1 MAG: hypothetical protein A2462_08230 [candidate division WOR-1 bacterium RIFOXYC2_FULL_41_25]